MIYIHIFLYFLIHVTKILFLIIKYFHEYITNHESRITNHKFTNYKFTNTYLKEYSLKKNNDE